MDRDNHLPIDTDATDVAAKLRQLIEYIKPATNPSAEQATVLAYVADALTFAQIEALGRLFEDTRHYAEERGRKSLIEQVERSLDATDND